MTALVLVFSEVLPKTWAIASPEVVGRPPRPAARGLRRASPRRSSTSSSASSAGCCARFGVAVDPEAHSHGDRGAPIALHHSDRPVETEDRDRLLGALDLGGRQVEEVMMHRRDIEMIDADAPPTEILDQAINSPHTRSRSSAASRRTSSA